MTIKAVFFDFYGTLCLLDDAAVELDEWITELHNCFCKYGLDATRDDVLEYYNQRMWRENPSKPSDGMTIFEKRIQIAGSDLGVTMTRKEIEDAAEALLRVWDSHAYYDTDTIPLLDSLAKRGMITALISNYDHPKHVHDHVRNSGMGDFFSAVIVSGDYDVKKPDPAIFRLAIKRTGALPEETIYVGDSEEDVLGANRAGLISVLINRSSEKRDYGQKHTIKTLQEIVKLVPRT
ncbi:MAG: HAD family hydrolase [Dehalococcoidales bacterium]|nr:HAD family hydrolase [Dehalococcoidales bacterium]